MDLDIANCMDDMEKTYMYAGCCWKQTLDYSKNCSCFNYYTFHIYNQEYISCINIFSIEYSAISI